MFERIWSALPEGNRKYPLRYRRLLNSMVDRLGFVKNRYLMSNPVMTKGMELLKFFITNVSCDSLDNYSSDIERYIEVIKFFKNNYLQAFDTAITGSITGDKWVGHQKAGGAAVPEIILNVDCLDPVQEFPLDGPWDQWQQLRAFRMHYHDSLEILEDFTTSVFEFKHDKPSFVVVSLDVSLLLFKYYKYWKACQTANIQPNIYKFLKQYEYAQLFNDMLDIWIINVLTYIFSHPEDATTDSVMDRIHVPQRIATDSMLRMGIDGIIEFVNLVQVGAMRPQDFLDTHWFLDQSLIDKIDELEKWVHLPDRHTYLWCKTLEWMPYLRILLNMTRLFPSGMIGQTIRIRAKEIYYKVFKYSRMPAIAHGESAKAFAETVDAEISSIIEQDPSSGSGQGTNPST